MSLVRDHLRDYLERSCRVVAKSKTKNPDDNVYLLIIQCFEVHNCMNSLTLRVMHPSGLFQDALSRQMSARNLTRAEKMEEVTRYVIQGYSALQDHHRHIAPNLEYLEGVAKVRYSLSVVAEVLKNEEHHMELLRAAGRMCSDRDVNCIDPSSDRGTVGPVVYLLKLLVRQYGMPCLNAAVEKHDWIIPEEVQPDKVTTSSITLGAMLYLCIAVLYIFV